MRTGRGTIGGVFRVLIILAVIVISAILAIAFGLGRSRRGSGNGSMTDGRRRDIDGNSWCRNISVGCCTSNSTVAFRATVVVVEGKCASQSDNKGKEEDSES